MATGESFTDNGLEFDIVAWTTDTGVVVESSYKGRQIARYTATYETDSAMHHQGWGNAVDYLIDFAKEDISRNQLPKLKAIRKAA